MREFFRPPLELPLRSLHLSFCRESSLADAIAIHHETNLVPIPGSDCFRSHPNLSYIYSQGVITLFMYTSSPLPTRRYVYCYMALQLLTIKLVIRRDTNHHL